MPTRRATDNAKALDAFMTTKFQIDAMLKRFTVLSNDHFKTDPDEINWGHVGTLNHSPASSARSPTLRSRRANMPPDPAQRHQIEQDAIAAEWEAERLAACDCAIALLREVADLERDDDVIIGTDADGQNNLMSRISAFLVQHDQ